MKETIEHNNRFYTNEKGEIKTENEQLKEWLIIANKHNKELQIERDMYKGSFETMSTNYFRLENIIKEVRELRKHLSFEYYEMGEDTNCGEVIKQLDEILDKVDKE